MGTDFLVEKNPDLNKAQNQQRIYTPLFNLIRRTIEAMLDSGELVIKDGVMTVPDESYTLSIEPTVEVENVKR